MTSVNACDFPFFQASIASDLRSPHPFNFFHVDIQMKSLPSAIIYIFFIVAKMILRKQIQTLDSLWSLGILIKYITTHLSESVHLFHGWLLRTISRRAILVGTRQMSCYIRNTTMNGMNWNGRLWFVIGFVTSFYWPCHSTWLEQYNIIDSQMAADEYIKINHSFQSMPNTSIFSLCSSWHFGHGNYIRWCTDEKIE